LEAGRGLRVQHRAPFSLHFGFDGWQQVQDREAVVGPFGLWSVQLSVQELAPHSEFNFTRRYGLDWEGTDHRILLGHVAVEHALEQIS
jgi:glucoamylase